MGCGWIGSLAEAVEDFAGELFDQALHFEAEEGDGDGAGGEGAAADDFVDGGIVVGRDGVVNFLLVFGEGEGGEDAGVGGAGGAVGGGEEVFEFAEDVLGAFAEFGAFLDEFVAAFAAGGIDAAGDGEDLAAVFDGHVGGDEGAAGEVGFDDDGAKGHAGDDAVADGEALFVGGTVEGKLGDDGAGGGDAFEEFGVFGREDEVDAGAEDGDGAALGGEGALMGGGVDAAGAAAGDGDADVGELIGEAAGGFEAVAGDLPGADDGDGVFVAVGEGAFDVEDDGRVVDLAEEFGVFGVVGDDDVAAVFADALEFAREVHGGFPAGDAFGGVLANAANLEELRLGGAEDGGGVAEVFEQLAYAHRADALDHVERDKGFAGIHAGVCGGVGGGGVRLWVPSQGGIRGPIAFRRRDR